MKGIATTSSTHTASQMRTLAAGRDGQIDKRVFLGVAYLAQTAFAHCFNMIQNKSHNLPLHYA